MWFSTWGSLAPRGHWAVPDRSGFREGVVCVLWASSGPHQGAGRADKGGAVARESGLDGGRVAQDRGTSLGASYTRTLHPHPLPCTFAHADQGHNRVHLALCHRVSQCC